MSSHASTHVFTHVCTHVPSHLHAHAYTVSMPTHTSLHIYTIAHEHVHARVDECAYVRVYAILGAKLKYSSFPFSVRGPNMAGVKVVTI